MPEKSIGRFHFLTDYHFQQRYSHARLAQLAIEGGADTIQFRDKIGGIRHVLSQAAETAAICKSLNAPFLIDDRIDVAIAVSADGVHLGQNDFPVREARRILGQDAVIGGTATTVDQALRMREAGADYVGFGPVFATTSKANPAAVTGLDLLNDVCEKVDAPVIAIAGITWKRIESVLTAGAYGVAVMTAVSTADDPVQAARDIRRSIDAALLRLRGSANGRSEAGR